jgi:hypothetical protein
MDIIEELNILKTSGYKDSFDYAMKKKEILDKKLHVIKVVNVVNQIENVINEGFFKENEVDSIKIEVCYNNQHYYYFSMHQGKKEVNFKDHTDNDVEPVERIKNAFDELNGLDLDYIGKVFNEPIFLDSNNLRNTILGILLSKELKTALDFSEMQCELSTNSVKKNLKNKV